MNWSRLVIAVLSLGLFAGPAFGFDEPLFHHVDPLAQRDEWGLLTQAPLNPTDFAPRHPRWVYFFQSRHTVLANPGYVGALQTALQRKGYYFGQIDGIFSPEISFAIARYQKANSMTVTGTLTIPVRRALYLP